MRMEVTVGAKCQYMDICLKCMKRKFNKKDRVWELPFYCLRKILEARKVKSPVAVCNFFEKRK